MRPNALQIWTVLVVLGVLLFWSTKLDVAILSRNSFITGADVLKVELKKTAVEQPIAFPHFTHAQKLGLECKFCHKTVETEAFATIPGINVCMTCHFVKITDNPEEEKIRTIAARGEEIPWVKLNEMPPHVYFSHRRHVVSGGLTCEVCMGNMAEQVVPPTRALINLNMEFCLDCHLKVGATQDCLLCHK